MSPWRAAAIGEDAHSVLSAITCRWTSQQNFTSRLVLEDRFTAANSELALAQPGHDPPFGLQVELPLERPLQLGCCHSFSTLSVLSKVRPEGRARSRAIAGGDVQTLDEMVHFVYPRFSMPLNEPPVASRSG